MKRFRLLFSDEFFSHEITENHTKGIDQETLFRIFLFLNRRIDDVSKTTPEDTRLGYKYKVAKKELQNLIALFS